MAPRRESRTTPRPEPRTEIRTEPRVEPQTEPRTKPRTTPQAMPQPTLPLSLRHYKKKPQHATTLLTGNCCPNLVSACGSGNRVAAVAEGGGPPRQVKACRRGDSTSGSGPAAPTRPSPATINYFDVLTPTEEEGDERAAPPATAAGTAPLEPVAAFCQAPTGPVAPSLTMEVNEDEALRAAMDEARKARSALDTACAAPPGMETASSATEADERRRQDERARRERSRRVQSISLCERLGLRYRLDAAPPSRWRKKKKRPPVSPAIPDASASFPPDAPAAPDAEAPPDALRAMAEENARLLSRIGWRKLAKKRRGRSALSADIGILPHDAAGYLDYLCQLGAPVHSSAPPKSPDNL